MIKSLTRVMYVVLFFSCFLCGCSKVQADDTGSEILKNESTILESQIVEDSAGIRCISAEDWLICESMLYLRTKDNVFQKSEFPHAVHEILSEENDKPIYLMKAENRLVIECKDDFVIYDFETDSIERLELTYGHSDWQIMHNYIYYIELDEYDGRQMRVYNMHTGDIKEIELGNYVPLQFHVREDGTIGIWGSDKESKMFCFWSNEKVLYVVDVDICKSWTNIHDYNEKGIIFEREYQPSSLKGTKIYQIQESGAITVLASSGDTSCDAKEIPIGELVFGNDYVLAINFSNGKVEVFDYEFSYREERRWDINDEKNMIFKGYYIGNTQIVGLWQSGELIRVVELKEKKYCLLK